MRNYIFPPVIFPLFIVLVLLPIFLILFVFTTSTVFQLVFGVDREEALLLFLLIVVGSVVNIPIYEKEGKSYDEVCSIFGLIYRVKRCKKIVVAINLGGCVFPSILAFKAFFEVIKYFDELSLFLAFLFAIMVSYMFAKPIRGVGIVMPMIVPPIVAVFSSLVAILLSSADLLLLPKLAFSVGVISTIVGADVLHLKDMEKIGEGVISIGGAGTFDGIFLTGIFSVLFSLFLI